MFTPIKHPLLATRYLLSDRVPALIPQEDPTVIIAGPRLKIEIHGMIGFKTDSHRDFYIKSMELKAIIWSSLDFKREFLKLNASETNGKTLQKIYDELILGNDRYSQRNDGDIDTRIHVYKTVSRSTIGYHNSCCLDTYVNSYFLEQWMKDKYGTARMAGHSGHEYFHVMGYSHFRIKSKSLVYKAGNLTTNLGLDYIKGKRALEPFS